MNGPEAIADVFQADPPTLEDGGDEAEPGLPAGPVQDPDSVDGEWGYASRQFCQLSRYAIWPGKGRSSSRDRNPWGGCEGLPGAGRALG